MKKILIILFVLIAIPVVSNLKDTEKNESNIKGFSFNIKFVVQNDRGSAEHIGKMLINNNHQIRYDEIKPERSTFIINNGFYTYYNYKDKKLFKSKISEMSFDHQVIVDQIFNFEIIYPLEYLKGKYNLQQENEINNTLWGMAKNNVDSKVKIVFENNRIKKIDFFYKRTIIKKITFVDYYIDSQVYFPTKITIEILKEPYFIIEFSISSIKNKQIVLESINESF